MSEPIKDILLQEVKSKFPSINWNLGSVVRELVLTPLARLADVFESRVDKAKASLDIVAICEDPVLNEALLDEWLTRLGIIQTTNETSSGTVRILRTIPDDLIITAGTQFSWNGEIIVATTETIRVSNTDDDNGSIKYTNYGDAVYSVDIPVTTASSTTGSLGSGAPLTWQGAPADVFDVHVGSAITGGYNRLTAEEKARRIKDAMTPSALSGEACIRKALRQNFPNQVIDVCVGRKEKENTVSIYVKPDKYPQEFYIEFTASAGEVPGSVTGIVPGCGLLSILEVYDSEGNRVNVTKDYDTGCSFGDSESSAEITINGSNVEGTYKAKVIGFKEYPELYEWLKSQSRSTPFSFKLKMPSVGLVRVDAVVSGSTYLSGVRSAISEAISGTSLNSTVSDSVIKSIASNYDLAVTRSIVYSTTVFYSGISSTYTSQGSVSPAIAKYTFGGVPVALYSQNNSIDLVNDKL